MTFTASEEVAGAAIHYLELLPMQTYSFIHGMLYSRADGFMRITQDYQLERVAAKTIQTTFEKNGRIYELNFSYVDSEEGVISPHKSLYKRNENGEILLNATSSGSYQWPVYVNPETCSVRDALAEYTAEDFDGREVYTYALRGGYLICTIIHENSSNSKNIYYYVSGAGEAPQIIDIPYRSMAVWKDSVYAQDPAGRLYRMDENFAFEMIADYRTADELTQGLLTVRTEQGELGILDALSEDVYVVSELFVNVNELDETRGYNASRYRDNGKIALVHTAMDYEKLQTVIDRIGIFDTNSGTLRYLQIDNGYDGYQNHWLDENRFAVVYSDGAKQYLCIYEFE